MRAWLGQRQQLGAIPLLIDEVNRDRFTREVPDLVKFDRERATLYAPVIISTNKQVSAVSPDIRKRAVMCLIDAAIPDQHATSKEIAHRAGQPSTARTCSAYCRFSRQCGSRSPNAQWRRPTCSKSRPACCTI